MATRARLATRKLLVASVGVASVSYVLTTGCDKRDVSTDDAVRVDGGRMVSGNLMPPRPRDASDNASLREALEKSLAADRDAGDADSVNAVLNGPTIDAATLRTITSGNLMAPDTSGPLLKKPSDAGATKKAR